MTLIENQFQCAIMKATWCELSDLLNYTHYGLLWDIETPSGRSGMQKRLLAENLTWYGYINYGLTWRSNKTFVQNVYFTQLTCTTFLGVICLPNIVAVITSWTRHAFINALQTCWRTVSSTRTFELIFISGAIGTVHTLRTYRGIVVDDRSCGIITEESRRAYLNRTMCYYGILTLETQNKVCKTFFVFRRA